MPEGLYTELRKLSPKVTGGLVRMRAAGQTDRGRCVL